jgi:hypothetical protein
MIRVLNDTNAASDGESIIDFIEQDLGLPAEEAIPALVKAIARFATQLDEPDEAMDEAAELLSDEEI